TLELSDKTTEISLQLLYCFLFSGFSSAGTQQPECIVPDYGVAIGPYHRQDLIPIDTYPEVWLISKPTPPYFCHVDALDRCHILLESLWCVKNWRDSRITNW